MSLHEVPDYVLNYLVFLNYRIFLITAILACPSSDISDPEIANIDQDNGIASLP